MSQIPATSSEPDARANRHAFRYSFTVAGISGFGLLLLLVATLGLPSASGLGYTTGRIMFPFSIAALITAFVARNSTTAWQWWRYSIVVVPTAILILIVSAI
jgi:hypothetical protein